MQTQLNRTVDVLSGLTAKVKLINEKMNTLVTQDSYDELYERIIVLSGLINNNSSSNTPESGEPTNPDAEPETPPTQEVTYVYECTACGDSSVIGKYRVITKEEYDNTYSAGFTFKESTATHTYTYYMNENTAVLIEEDRIIDDTYGTVYVYTIMESQMGTWLYCYPYDTAILMCSTLEAVMDFEWQLHYGAEPPPSFIKL